MSKVLGEGTFGCVVSPPPACKIPCTLDICKTGVSKITSLYDAQEESKQMDIVNKLDPTSQWHIPFAVSCNPVPESIPEGCGLNRAKWEEVMKTEKEPLRKMKPEKQKELEAKVKKMKNSELTSVQSLISKKANGDLSHFFMDFDTRVVLDMQNIFIGIETLNTNGYIHGDIKPHNMLYDDTNFYLSDFGTLEKWQLYTSGGEPDTYRYFYYPPEEIELRDLKGITPKYIETFMTSFQGYNIPYFNNYSNDTIRAAIGIKYAKGQVRNYSVLKFDTYSLGVTLHQLRENYPSYIYGEFKTLVKKMVNPNLMERINIINATREYGEICRKHKTILTLNNLFPKILDVAKVVKNQRQFGEEYPDTLERLYLENEIIVEGRKFKGNFLNYVTEAANSLSIPFIDLMPVWIDIKRNYYGILLDYLSIYDFVLKNESFIIKSMDGSATVQREGDKFIITFISRKEAKRQIQNLNDIGDYKLENKTVIIPSSSLLEKVEILHALDIDVPEHPLLSQYEGEIKKYTKDI